jgi:hypothetical protein
MVSVLLFGSGSIAALSGPASFPPATAAALTGAAVSAAGGNDGGLAGDGFTLGGRAVPGTFGPVAGERSSDISCG